MAMASNDGVRLAYDIAGPDDAETVAFVEGLAYGTWMWQWQREPLSDDYRTLVWDIRGTGDSEESEGPYTTAMLAADFEAVLADAGIDSAHVVGASLGGMIALQHALDYDRVDSLTLLGTSHGGPEAVPTPAETSERIASTPDHLDETGQIRYKMAPAVSDEFRDSETFERIVEWRLSTDPSPAAYQSQAAAAQTFDVRDRLDEITQPTLVVHGTADQVVPFENARLLAGSIPNATLRPIEDGSHLCFIEQSDAVTGHIQQFLDGIEDRDHAANAPTDDV